MREIIKYHNDMNKVSFAGFKEKELDLFFSICQKMKEKGTNEVIFSFTELRKISQYSNRSVERLYSDLDKVYKKMLELNLKYENDKEIRRFVLFNKYIIRKEEKIILIKSSEDFEYVLNNLIGNFTKFDLIEFISLKSIYSKNMFKLLKQWESKKERDFEIEEFRNLLTIPEKYRMSIIDLKVLKPILVELPKYFPNLKLEKIKTGKKITNLKFTWESKKEIVETKKAPEKIEISQELFDLIKKIQTLDFFQGIMTSSNIENLIKKYDENTLMQILKRARKHTYQQIKSLKYFDYIYESIKSEPVITIKQTKKPIKKEEQYQFEKAEEFKKIDITRKELNKKYKEYLEKVGLPDNIFMKKGFEMPYNIVEEES